MKMSILSLALGVVLASPLAAHASENPYGRVHGHRTTHQATIVSNWNDPFKPRRTDGLSSNPNVCASYGCVGAGGGGD
jgi:hypothetical protein